MTNKRASAQGKGILPEVNALGVSVGREEPAGAGPGPEADRPEGPVSGLPSLTRAVSEWVERGRQGPLARWLGRELDADGVPLRLPVPDWVEGLDRLALACRLRPSGWPDRFDLAAEGWFRALLRHSRPDGAPVFSGSSASNCHKALFREWADRVSDPGLSTVVDWWFPRPARGRHSPPPLPADSRPDRPLSVLRANWARDGDLIAIDHREGGTSTLVELFGQGHAWLGPHWASGGPDGPVSRARPVLWVSHSTADLFEWSFRAGRARVVRTAVLLRGRRLALLGEHWEGTGDPGPWRLGLAEGVEASPLPGCRGLILTRGARRPRAQVLPLSLPRHDSPTDRGAVAIEGREIVLNQKGAGWRVVLISWEPTRNRPPVHWRTLTVSENSRAVSPETAFAARVTWERDETLVVYRSLRAPAPRAFLGHPTRDRFLVGLFSRVGEVEPLLKVEA